MKIIFTVNGGIHKSSIGSQSDSFIGGGDRNTIHTHSDYAGIASGVCNHIFPVSPTTCSQYSFIGGGKNNCIYNNSSAILGGSGNTVSGAYSSVLGGSGNTISAAYNHAGVFGCNVTATFNCAFHANQFVAPNTIPYGIAGASLIQYIPVTACMIAMGFPGGSCVVVM